MITDTMTISISKPCETFLKTKSEIIFLIGSILTSLGILLVTVGGSWDITNHLLSKPETFFSPPHALMYFGVAVSLSGAVLSFIGWKNLQKSRDSYFLSLKIKLIGIGLLTGAGPLDFFWHSYFGLDGLLSPPHFTLITGMFLCSVGGMIGISRYLKFNNSQSIAKYLLILAVIPVWLSASGIISSLSLPFSSTDFFEFNPEPTFAAVFATIVYPIVMAFILVSSSKVNPGRFGYLSTTGAFYILIMILSALLPNPVLVDAVPFYLLNLVPFVLADVIINKSKIKKSHYIAGAMIGSSFIFSYFPLITYTYNEVMFHRLVWPSMIPLIYSEFIVVIFPMLIACGAVSSLIGTLIAVKVSRRIIL